MRAMCLTLAANLSSRMRSNQFGMGFSDALVRRRARLPSAASQRYQPDKARLACRRQDELLVEIADLTAVEQHDDAAVFDSLDRGVDLRLQLQGAKPLLAIPVQFGFPP